MFRSSSRGFTLIELLVVVAIIGLLASIVLSALGDTRAKGRDARRISDLRAAGQAISLWNIQNGNYVQTGSGCGYNGDGNGWFNYQGGSYPQAISMCLHNAGFTPKEIIDPTGARSGSNPTNSTYTYMKCSCANGTFMFAKLESQPQSGTALDGTCCTDYDSSYGMNYWLKVQ